MCSLNVSSEFFDEPNMPLSCHMDDMLFRRYSFIVLFYCSHCYKKCPATKNAGMTGASETLGGASLSANQRKPVMDLAEAAAIVEKFIKVSNDVTFVSLHKVKSLTENHYKISAICIHYCTPYCSLSFIARSTHLKGMDRHDLVENLKGKAEG